MAGRLEFTFDAPKRGAAPRPRRGALRLLVMGDFSGRASADRPPLADRPTHRVDLDCRDAVLARLAPRLALGGETLAFESIDDFHPDRLYQRVAVFAALREARAKPPAAGSDLLGELLGKPATPATAGPAAATGGIDALIRQIVAPHIVADTTAETRSYLAAVDAATAEQMRRLLHDPAFQALESAWRGVNWLIESLELGDELELHLFDATRDELLADIVGAQGRLAQTGLHRALADRWRSVPGGAGWNAVAGLYRFGGGDVDVGLLAALGIVASQAGGPLLAEADPALAAEPTAGWQALRRSEAAPWIGLAAPRVLLRRPYGRRSEPVDGFAFEEFAATPPHEALLWGNPALALLLLVGRAFSASGWDFEPGDEREIGDLPAVTIELDGERELVPCAEVLLGEQRANLMLAAGLMPVASHKHANAVTVMRLQSIAEPAAALAGL